MRAAGGGDCTYQCRDAAREATERFGEDTAFRFDPNDPLDEFANLL